tara:strand:- start:1061 stop:1312 length:252 start_codon:yes stop_codon:yes gene_type:complete
MKTYGKLNHNNQAIVTALRDTDSKGSVKVITRALENGSLIPENTKVSELFELIRLERYIQEKTLHIKKLKQDVEDLRKKLGVL